ncbi:MAG: stage III sporulation protein AC [Clostridiales bacterium]|nr:stage III sporulation protein AC [Clostridiales bacterium]
MDSALLIKVAGIGLLVAVAHQILTRAGREEQAMLLSVTGTVVVLLMLTEKIGDLFNSIRSIFGI